jgi:signal transduction histidine kinase
MASCLAQSDRGLGEIVVSSLRRLERRCPNFESCRRHPQTGCSPEGERHRHHFANGFAAHPPQTKNRWLARRLSDRFATSATVKRVALRSRSALTIRLLSRSTLRWLVVATLAPVCFTPTSHAGVRKIVLMITEVGHSHPGPVIVTNAIVSAMQSDSRFEEEFQWENLDAVDISDDSLNELRDSIVQKYRNQKLDLIVLEGPDPLRFLAEPAKPFFPDVPIVFCCSVLDQVDRSIPDSRSTGSWFQLDPAKTLDAALHLLPETRQVFVTAGQSRYDRRLTALVKTGLNSYEPHLDITYLPDLPMAELQERLRHLPSRSIVLYLSFFKDALGRRFLSASEALPLITAASSAPVFGISSTYLGHGIVGGFVVSVEGQAEIATRDVLEILAGKPPQDIPIVHGPSFYQFDWRELRRWNLDQTKLPAGSIILFRQPAFWDRHKWNVLTGLLLLLWLSLLAFYGLRKQKQLESARIAHVRLGGMLITAQETERSRLASEIHDDFSQRLALLALGLENAAEAIGTSPAEAIRQIYALLDSASEIGADLHTFSHRLHSSTLDRLGLVPGVGALCKEFATQQVIEVDFLSEDVPHSVHPDVALCAFRIIQEALRNCKKHSGAAKVQVRLRAAADRLYVSVYDKGVGFDIRELRKKEGLGIRSMEERAYVLGGRFEIHSEPWKGTRIEAWIPVQPRLTQAAG